MRVAYHLLELALVLLASQQSLAFSSSTVGSKQGEILILDHLNINHEQGKQAWVKSFYFDFLNLVPDPRKEENLDKGKGTVWANIGSNQFHIPEGKPDAQVLEGLITLSYPNLSAISNRIKDAKTSLIGSQFHVEQTKLQEELLVTDPWGTRFRLIQGDEADRDPRGQQPGAGSSEGMSMRDLTIYTPTGTCMEGISRFYSHVFRSPTVDLSPTVCSIAVGHKQTLTFLVHPEKKDNVVHDDLRAEGVQGAEEFDSNYGPHVSLYVADLKGCYMRSQELGITYVNPRFKRRAFNLEEAIGDCMFRVIDIKDPEAPDTIILRLEHEVRSVTKKDGSIYKSCPFDDIPESCVSVPL